MLLFITSEVMFFAGLFAAYFNLRANFIDADGVQRWPPRAPFEHIRQPVHPAGPTEPARST